jgi:hypothetical protein
VEEVRRGARGALGPAASVARGENRSIVPDGDEDLRAGHDSVEIRQPTRRFGLQLIPSGELEIVPAAPTATNRGSPGASVVEPKPKLTNTNASTKLSAFPDALGIYRR